MTQTTARIHIQSFPSSLRLAVCASIVAAGAAGAQLPSRPPPPDTLRYTQSYGPTPIGLLRAWQDTDATVHFELESHVRGVDTSLYTIIRPGPTGLPTEVMYTPGDTAPNPGTRWFTIGDDSVRMWVPGLGATPTRAPFMDLSWQPKAGALAMLAHAAHESGDSIVFVAPESPLLAPIPARVRLILSRRAGTGANDVRIDLYAITYAPAGTRFVWVDDHGRLFADERGGLIRQGYEDERGALLTIADSLTAPALAAMAHTLGVQSPSGLAIVHATLVDVDAKVERPNTTVIIRDHRIVSVGPDASAPVSSAMRVLDATGQWLVPGLWDMDAHVADGNATELRDELASGITTVRNLGSVTIDPFAALRRARRIDAGNELGPRVISAAAVIDGPGTYSAPTAAIVTDAETAAQWVDVFADSGFQQVNIGSSLAPALVPGIVTHAHQRGLRVGGAVPFGMTATQSLQEGYDEIEHIMALVVEFLSGAPVDTRMDPRVNALDRRSAEVDLKSPAVAELVSQIATHHVAVDPTLCAVVGTDGARDGDVASAGSRAMTTLAGMLYRAGVPLLAGSDEHCTLVDELRGYVAAGVPAIEVLRIATLGAATQVHREADLGSIAVGKLADFDLVASDPLADLDALNRVTTVIKDGVLYDPAKLRATPLIFP